MVDMLIVNPNCIGGGRWECDKIGHATQSFVKSARVNTITNIPYCLSHDKYLKFQKIKSKFKF